MLAARVLGPASTIPAPVRAEVFGDVALQQLAELAGAAVADVASDSYSRRHGGGEGEGEAGRGSHGLLSSLQQQGGGGAGGQTVAQMCVHASVEVLVCLLTDPDQGLVEAPGPIDAPLALGPGSAAAASGGPTSKAASKKAAKSGALPTAGAGGAASGAKRVLRLLPRLRPAESVAHGRVMEALAAAQPALIAEFLSGASHLRLEPQVGEGTLCVDGSDFRVWQGVRKWEVWRLGGGPG